MQKGSHTDNNTTNEHLLRWFYDIRLVFYASPERDDDGMLICCYYLNTSMEAVISTHALKLYHLNIIYVYTNVHIIYVDLNAQRHSTAITIHCD